MPQRLKTIISWAFKGTLTLGLLGWLIAQDKLNLELLGMLVENPLFLGLVGLQLLVFLPLNSLRWLLFLKALDLNQSFWRAHKVTWVGFFFNTVLPGALTGDLVKAYYVVRPGVSGEKTRAGASLILDRFTGLFGLVFLGTAALALHPDWLVTSGPMQGLALFVAFLFVCTLVFYALVLIRFEPGRDPVLYILKRLPKGEFLGRVYGVFKSFEAHPGVLAATLGLTLAIHGLIAGYFYLISQALGMAGPGWIDQILIMPLGLITTAIPVAPGGAGLGHAAFDQLYGLFGAIGGADVFNFYMVIQLLGFAPGGLIYLKLSRNLPLEEEDAP